MKVSEAVEYMTVKYLHRIIDSFTKDLPKQDEDRTREIILRNVEELTDPQRVATALAFDGFYSDQVLYAYILEAMLNRPDYLADETDIVEEVTALEQAVITTAADPDALRYEDPHATDVLRAVLEVALEDQQVSDEELNLVRRLREKLGLAEQSKRIILAQLGHFPRSGNRVHTPSEFRDALIELQRRGVLFYCNKLESGRYVVPDEIVRPMRTALGIELGRKAWERLLDNLTKGQLEAILGQNNLPRYGSKGDLVQRVIAAAIRPGKALDVLSNDELYNICDRLPGVKVSGSKQNKVERVIDHFSKLVMREVPEEASSGLLFFEYLVELAHRDRENLLANKVIRKDREMDSAFEEGTRYLFEEVLGVSLMSMPGSDHPDGCFEFGKNRELLMWDNKSKESVYTFPRSHLTQFKRYIRDSDCRVSCFLVIVPQIDGDAGHNAARLKVESGTDTDVALITAEDLKWLARQWSERAKDRAFDAEVFNITGVLDRAVLEQRMRLFL